MSRNQKNKNPYPKLPTYSTTHIPPSTTQTTYLNPNIPTPSDPQTKHPIALQTFTSSHNMDLIQSQQHCPTQLKRHQSILSIPELRQRMPKPTQLQNCHLGFEGVRAKTLTQQGFGEHLSGVVLKRNSYGQELEMVAVANWEGTGRVSYNWNWNWEKPILKQSTAFVSFGSG
ncbi:hypothetical protein M758_3G132600 [Ceratodon purpureus]|nr:hypothetical protein M758_3G132600 [Ceratodon purpureus]